MINTNCKKNLEIQIIYVVHYEKYKLHYEHFMHMIYSLCERQCQFSAAFNLHIQFSFLKMQKSEMHF